MDIDVAVVGAGISGLAVAHRLRAAGRSVQVFESSAHVGGRMRTVRREGHLIDTGAEMIGTHGYPATWRLAHDLGLSEEDAPVIGRHLAMWREGRAHPDVGDPRGLVHGAGMSVAARVGLAKLMAGATMRRGRFDVDHPERTPMGERTLREVARRYHPDVHDYLLQPMAGAFFGWDTADAAAGPLVSHLLAVGATRTFRTWSDGMDTLSRRLASQLDVSTGAAVQEVASGRGHAQLVVDGSRLSARTVVLAVPAPVAAQLYPGAPEFVRVCEFRPIVKVVCLLDRPIEPADGSSAWAVAVPAVENPTFAGFLVDDRKHPGRVPSGRGMVTLAAGAASAGLIDRSNDEIVDALMPQAERYLPGLASACRVSVVVRYRHGLPMPTAAALAARAEFVRREVGPVEYAGDWCALRPCSEAAVRSAEVAAERVGARRAAVVVSRG